MLKVLQTVFTFSATICLVGSFLLFYHKSGMKVREYLAWIMLMWGLAFVLRVVETMAGYSIAMYGEVMSLPQVILGTIYAFILLLWPLEVVKPGWLNIWRVLRLLLPYFLVVAIYFAAISIFGLQQFKLVSFKDFISHIGYFTVWYRIIFALCTIPYLVYMFYLVRNFSKTYKLWCEDNFASTEPFQTRWLTSYGIGVVVIAIAFYVNILWASPYSMLAHNLISGIFFLYLLMISLKHFNPYPEGYFSSVSSDISGRNEDYSRDAIPTQDENASFESRMDEYKDRIEEWFAKEKPFMRQRFKLMDMNEIIPLNRTYLSRIFNEGFGQSFHTMVRDYRMEEAERILIQNPEIPVNDVAESCGYSTPQAFHRAFTETHNGLTPKAFIALQSKNQDYLSKV